MSETEWQGGSELWAMLRHIAPTAGEREFRLFACACVRRRWSLLRYPAPREAVALAERLAEGQATPEEREAMWERAQASVGSAPMFELSAYQAAAATLDVSAGLAAQSAAELIVRQASQESSYEATSGPDEVRAEAEATATERRALAEVLREVFGNPFRPSVIDPAWLAWSGGVVPAIARHIDELQKFDETPYLADALTDAGCGDEAILRHLRGGGHVRGCWALDAVLGRR